MQCTVYYCSNGVPGEAREIHVRRRRRHAVDYLRHGEFYCKHLVMMRMRVMTMMMIKMLMVVVWLGSVWLSFVVASK